MNAPPRGSSRSDASVSSPASAFSTMSMPAPSVAARNFCSKPASLDEAMRVSWSRPMAASAACLPGEAVA